MKRQPVLLANLPKGTSVECLICSSYNLIDESNVISIYTGKSKLELIFQQIFIQCRLLSSTVLNTGDSEIKRIV